MNYKLIVSDIDGTLVSHGKGLSQSTKELVYLYQKMGGDFTIATGRMEEAIYPFIEQLNIDMPVIIYNGAAIVKASTGEVVYQSRLDYDIAKSALKICREYQLDPILYMNKKAYISQTTASIAKYEKKENVKCIEVGCLDEFLTVSPIKILFIGDEKGFGPFKNHLQQLTTATLNFICSEYNYLELLPKEVSKGLALKILVEKLNISMEEVIAIGDERNDASMIETAGLGVAVRNAKPELLDKADYITMCNCNIGVEEILYKTINNIKIT